MFEDQDQQRSKESKMSSDMTSNVEEDRLPNNKSLTLGTWDIVAVVGYFVVILGVGMLVC